MFDAAGVMLDELDELDQQLEVPLTHEPTS